MFGVNFKSGDCAAFFPEIQGSMFEMGRSLLDQAGSAEDSLKYFLKPYYVSIVRIPNF